jgi:hypothetical protein
VPDNATQVHCLGTDGDGPVVRGPLTVKGWDPFELDPDGDKNACVDPGAQFDYFGQELDGIALRGWAFDPNTADPISIDVYDHGFDLAAAGNIGETRKICVAGINIGTGNNSLIKCKTITLYDIGQMTNAWGDIVGMIESADRVPGGIRVRGFGIYDYTQPLGGWLIGSPGYGTTFGINGPTLNLNVVRDDVADVFGLPTGVAYGFDQVVPEELIYYGGPGICLRVRAGASGVVNVMCRQINS